MGRKAYQGHDSEELELEEELEERDMRSDMGKGRGIVAPAMAGHIYVRNPTERRHMGHTRLDSLFKFTDIGSKTFNYRNDTKICRTHRTWLEEKMTCDESLDSFQVYT